MEMNIEYLNEERIKLWDELRKSQGIVLDLEDRIKVLQATVDKKTSDYEKEAAGASKKASEYRNRAQDSFKTVEQLLSTVSANEMVVKAAADKVNELVAQLGVMQQTSAQNSAGISKMFDTIQNKNAEYEPKLEQVDETIEKIQEQLAEADRLATGFTQVSNNAQSLVSKITSFHTQANEAFVEIKNVYDKIMGYDNPDNNSKDSRIKGLKDKLQTVYTALEKGMEKLRSDLVVLKDEKAKEFKAFVDSTTTEYSEIKGKIESLLPDAMTAGLSHAYAEKRQAEETECAGATRSFIWAIAAMAVVSLFPIGLNLYLHIVNKVPVDEIILKLPYVASAILPLYLPIVWFAFSVNKRAKLSKRLIEEYAHKEALSKTFEGLSTQIKNLKDGEESEVLKLRLLYNVVSVSAENPGKLILNYNNADNPILEVLDKSISMTKSLEKLSAIPGFRSIAEKWLAHQGKTIVKVTDDVTKGLNAASE